MKETILITGDLGFVGQHLQEALDWKGHGYDLRRGQDIRNLHDLDRTFEWSQCTTVVHLAALAGVRRGNDYPDDYISTNINGTWNVVKMCEKYNCRLINFSSSSVYGYTSPPTSENNPKKPASLYGISKLAAEHICENAKIPVTTIRPFTIYGPGGRPDQVFYKWINQIRAGKKVTVYGDDRQAMSCRGYTYVKDLVACVVNLSGKEWQWRYEDFNLGGQEVITITNLIALFADNIPGFREKIVYLPRLVNDVTLSWANINKAKQLLNFNPPHRFNEFVTKIIKEADL